MIENRKVELDRKEFKFLLQLFMENVFFPLFDNNTKQKVKSFNCSYTYRTHLVCIHIFRPHILRRVHNRSHTVVQFHSTFH